MLNFDEGGTCSFFSEEKKEPKKSRLCLSPANHLSSDVFRELYTGSYITFLRRLTRPEPAAFAVVNICGSRKL